MNYCSLKFLILAWGLLFPLFLFSAHFENLIDLTIKVEDASFNHRVKSISFNNQEIKLDDPDMFKPRKISQHHLSPGRYMLTWTTEKSGTLIANASPLTKHEKIVVLESGDVSVKINIKGDTVSLY